MTGSNLCENCVITMDGGYNSPISISVKFSKGWLSAIDRMHGDLRHKKDISLSLSQILCSSKNSISIS